MQLIFDFAAPKFGTFRNYGLSRFFIGVYLCLDYIYYLCLTLAIIGSRTCPPVDIEAYLDEIPDAIVSGRAKGADSYARAFATYSANAYYVY